MADSADRRRLIASPWVLGLYGLASATFIVGAHIAHWYGGAGSPTFLFPFAAMLGGLAQFVAAIWAYATADVLATAMLGTWGAAWLAYGVLYSFAAAGKVAIPQGAFPELAYWFIVLAAITWVGAALAGSEYMALATVFVLLAAASTLMAIAEGFGLRALTIVSGWLFLLGGISAWYTGSAMMFADVLGRETLPLGKPVSVARSRVGEGRQLGVHHAA